MGTAVGRLWKRWPVQAARDGRAVLRIDGKRYERRLVVTILSVLFVLGVDEFIERTFQGFVGRAAR